MLPMPDASRATMLADRAVLRVSGAEARSFLQGLVTQDLALLAPDRPLWTALLTPQGKVLFDFVLWAGDGDDVLLDVEATQAGALGRRLLLYRLRRPVAIEPVDAAVHWSQAGSDGLPDPRLAALGRRWIGSAAQPAQGWLSHRLSLGVTEGVAEFGNGDTLWLECNARELGGVSFTKGCYVGQENTARMHHRAKVNRRLIVAPFDGDEQAARKVYPELKLLVARRAVETLGDAIIAPWLRAVLPEREHPATA